MDYICLTIVSILQQFVHLGRMFAEGQFVCVCVCVCVHVQMQVNQNCRYSAVLSARCGWTSRDTEVRCEHV